MRGVLRGGESVLLRHAAPGHLSDAAAAGSSSQAGEVGRRRRTAGEAVAAFGLRGDAT